MAKVISLSWDALNKIFLLISGYTMLELISLYSFDFSDWLKYDTAKALAVIAPLIWYIYLFTKAISSRKTIKENQAIERDILERKREHEIRRKIKEEAELKRIEFENRLLEKKIKEQENTGT